MRLEGVMMATGEERENRGPAAGGVDSVGRGLVQGGATMAKGLFPVIGVVGTTAVRIGLSAVLLLPVFGPPVHRVTAAQWRPVVAYGITIGLMNLLFYQALARIPLCLLVTLAFA